MIAPALVGPKKILYDRRGKPQRRREEDEAPQWKESDLERALASRSTSRLPHPQLLFILHTDDNRNKSPAAWNRLRLTENKHRQVSHLKAATAQAEPRQVRRRSLSRTDGVNHHRNPPITTTLPIYSDTAAGGQSRQSLREDWTTAMTPSLIRGHIQAQNPTIKCRRPHHSSRDRHRRHSVCGAQANQPLLLLSSCPSNGGILIYDPGTPSPLADGTVRAQVRARPGLSP